MDKQCRGCASHHNAGHPKGSPMARKYNDWCCYFCRTASRALGECKLKGGHSGRRASPPPAPTPATPQKEE